MYWLIAHVFCVVVCHVYNWHWHSHLTCEHHMWTLAEGRAQAQDTQNRVAEWLQHWANLLCCLQGIEINIGSLSDSSFATTIVCWNFSSSALQAFTLRPLPASPPGGGFGRGLKPPWEPPFAELWLNMPRRFVNGGVGVPRSFVNTLFRPHRKEKATRKTL